MQHSGIMGNFYVVAEWIYKFTVVNLIWTVVNLPIVFLLFNLLLADKISVIFTLLVMILFLAPFILYPSTSALYFIVNRFIIKEDVKLLSDFFSSYKENYKRSMKIGFVFSVFWAVLIIDVIYVIESDNEALTYLFLLLGFFGFIYNLHVFSSTVYMEAKTLILLKKTAILMFSYPIISMSLGLVSVAFIFMVTQFLPLLIPFIFGSVISFLALLVFIKIYNKLKN